MSQITNLLPEELIRQTGWLKVLNPSVTSRLGKLQHVLFDFDGTLSVLRQGWEDVMAPLMVEMIYGGNPPIPEIEREVRDYVDLSTGILTIRQMEWLVEAVRRYGLAGAPRTAAEYKALYLKRLMVSVQERIDRLSQGLDSPLEKMIAGSQEFVAGLANASKDHRHQISLYLTSGTDHPDVVLESHVLGMDRYFAPKIYGALDASEAHDKERIIRRILTENELHGDELLVVGDGPVEIRVAVECSAITLGVASDEVARQGWNLNKIERLTRAGADLLVPDFTQATALLTFLRIGSKELGDINN